MFSINDNDDYAELFALKGVEQPEKWHPEGDAYAHTMMVIRQAAIRYPDDELLTLAAACHDLGKALTPKEEWPKHYGHAKRGVKPTRSLLTRLGIDEETIEKICFTTEYHMHIHDAFKLNHKTYVKIYNKIHDISGGEILKIFSLITLFARLGECDHYGRGNAKTSYHSSYLYDVLCAMDGMNYSQKYVTAQDYKLALEICEVFKLAY